MPSSAGAGRSLNSLMETYIEQTHKPLSNYIKTSDSVYISICQIRSHISICQGLSLSKYISTRTEHCKIAHPLPCNEYTSMLSVAQRIKQNGWEKLGVASKNTFPDVSYTPHCARRFLQMPLVCICVDYKPGVHEYFLLVCQVSIIKISFTCFKQLLSILHHTLLL